MGRFLNKILFFIFTAFATLSFSQKQENVIENINSSVDVNNVTVQWNVKYDKLPLRKKLVIRYLPENLTKMDLSPDWNYTPLFSSDSTHYELKNLKAAEKYAYSLGVVEDSTITKIDKKSAQNVNWHKTKTVETKRGWTMSTGLIMRILMLLGALALFIYGMKIMSEGIQKAAGENLRKILGSMTSNRFKGILTGFLTTSIIQSSSATTVMVVSFVNAGLLSLRQSIGVIMGANVGTTVTAWLVAFLGFSVSMSDYALPIFLVALIFIFARKHSLKSWGEMLAGFALLFIGLEMLKNGVPDVKGSVSQLAFLQDLSNHGIVSVLIFVMIGTIVTIVVQSSSAAMAVTILLCERGIIPFEMAAGMVLGENIGTTITANLAAIVANVHAKRAARAHFIFNVFGVIWMIFLFPYYIDWVDQIVSLNYISPKISQDSRPIALAYFHTGFNIMNVLLMVWFVPQIARIVTWMVPSKSERDEEFRLDYIKAGILNTPELFILEANKEVAKFAKITSKMSKFVNQLIVENDKKEKSKLYDKIAKYEEITDRVEIEISNYLSRCAENELSEESSIKVRGMLAITNDLERIGDIFYQMSLTYKRKEDEKIWFSPEQRDSVKHMIKLLDEAFAVMLTNLKTDRHLVKIDLALEKETDINNYRDDLRVIHLSSIENQEYNVKSGIIYTDLIYSCEKVGDHIINVTEAIIGKNIIGEQKHIKIADK